MSGEEIRKKIDENNLILSNVIEPIFVLNKDKWRALKENEELRKICPHEFKNGFCIYCDAVEETWK